MYAERVMFHGPQYRGVEAVHAVGERHIRGRLRTPGAARERCSTAACS